MLYYICCGLDVLDGARRGLSAWRRRRVHTYLPLPSSPKSGSSSSSSGVFQWAGPPKAALRKHRDRYIQQRTILALPSLPGSPRYLQKPSFQEAEASGAFLHGAPDGEEGAPPESAGPRGENSAPPPSAPEVAIDSGVVVFSGEATSALAGLAYSETFEGCTARGVAKGAPALRLELYSDLLLALKTGAGGATESEEGTYTRRG